MDLYEELLRLAELDLVYLLADNGAGELGVDLTELGEDVQAGTADPGAYQTKEVPQPSPGRGPLASGPAVPAPDQGPAGDRSRPPGYGRCRRRWPGWRS